MAHLARHLDVGQEVHLDGLITVATTRLTTSAFHIKREPPRFVSSDLGLRQANEQTADVGEDTCVGGWIGAWCAPDGTLIDIHHFIYIFYSLDTVVGHGLLQRTVEMLTEDGLQGLVDEGRFARAADTSDDNESAERKLHVDMFQVVASATF